MKKFAFVVPFLFLVAVSSQAFAGFSAIAYNPDTKAWGEGHGYDTSDDAWNAAIAACGGGCIGLAVSENACVALANDPNSGAYGYSWNYDNADDAVNAAEASCDSQISSGACAWQVWACN